jgi:predicted ATPase
VPATIAHALAVVESVGRSARELLAEHLRDRQLLLVLDNFEHVLGAAPLLA